MTYVIDPKWFYWLSVFDALKVLCVVIATVGTVVAIICFLIALAEDCDVKLLFLIVIPILLIAIAGAIFIPSKATMIEMQVAKMATQENLAWTVDQVKSVVDYIVEAIKAIK